MNSSHIAAILLRQFYLFRGSPARILPLFVWEAIDVTLWGFITRYLDSVSASGINFVSSLLGTVLLWNFLTRVMHGVTMAFFEDVWSRNFLNLFATPLRISEYLAGLVLSSLVTSSIGLGVMVLVAWAVFDLSLFTYGLMLAPFFMVLFLFGIALGVFGSAAVLRLGPAAEWLIWPIPAMVAPFACVFYPRSALPEWMQWASRLTPPSYVFEGMREIVSDGTFSGRSLAWGLGLALTALVLACGFFTRVYHEAVRTGRIARYSAESVT